MRKIMILAMLPLIVASCTFKEKQSKEIVIDSTNYTIHDKYIEVDSVRYCYSSIVPIYPGNARGFEIVTLDASGKQITVIVKTQI